jgi:hypothetical protein
MATNEEEKKCIKISHVLCVRFEVLEAMLMKIHVLSDVVLCRTVYTTNILEKLSALKTVSSTNLGTLLVIYTASHPKR